MSALVLVVDDDPDLRMTVADVLEYAGYRVETAANGALALEVLKQSQERPALILLDMMMPVMDGWEFCAEKAKRPELADIPVIVFSAHADIQDAAKDVRAVSSLKKPLRAKTLVDAVANHLPQAVASDHSSA